MTLEQIVKLVEAYESGHWLSFYAGIDGPCAYVKAWDLVNGQRVQSPHFLILNRDDPFSVAQACKAAADHVRIAVFCQGVK